MSGDFNLFRLKTLILFQVQKLYLFGVLLPCFCTYTISKSSRVSFHFLIVGPLLGSLGFDHTNLNQDIFETAYFFYTNRPFVNTKTNPVRPNPYCFETALQSGFKSPSAKKKEYMRFDISKVSEFLCTWLINKRYLPRELS